MPALSYAPTERNRPMNYRIITIFLVFVNVLLLLTATIRMKYILLAIIQTI